MLVAMRFHVPESTGPEGSGPEATGLESAGEAFAERARLALGVLAGCSGYRRGDLARAYDDPTRWCLLTEWESVGAYRRALGAFDVKVHAVPLLAQALDEPSAFEPLASAAPGGAVVVATSDRAAGHGGTADRAAGHGGAAGALRSRP